MAQAKSFTESAAKCHTSRPFGEAAVARLRQGDGESPAQAALRARRSGWGGGPVEYRRRVAALAPNRDADLAALAARLGFA